MGWNMNPNAVNQFIKGTDIYNEGDTVFSIAMIVKGRVLIHNAGAKLVMSSGAFLGIHDLYEGKYQSTYTAYDDVMIYVFPTNTSDDLEGILSFNKDYHGFMVASYYKMIYELNQIYLELIKLGSEITGYLTDTYQNYLASGTQRGFKVKQSKRIENLTQPENKLELLRDRINYYSECRNLPMDAVKLFYSYGNVITLYQIEEQMSIVNQLMEEVKSMTKDFVSLTECLVDDSDTCLFQLITSLAPETDNISGMELLDILDSIVDFVNRAERFSNNMLGIELKADRSKMEEGYHSLLTSSIAKSDSSLPEQKYSKEDSTQALSELKDSFDKILEYAELNGAQALDMKSAMSDYVQLADKASSEDSAREIRKKVTDIYYTIYKRVFLRAYKEKKSPRLMELFLKYGMADDRLLTKEQLLTLYFLPEEEPQQVICGVYDIKTWLTLIYEGKREPSKNEFDLEYPEMVASMKKQGKLSETEAIHWLKDSQLKLEYEIHNMFRYNNRTSNGQITSFVPVLNGAQFASNIEKMLTTATRVNEVVAKLIKIDYSIFDRTVIYSNQEKNIIKEYIIKRVYPEFILMPNNGNNGIMWQEISGKKRDSAGRFILPIFMEANMTALLMRIFGRYRWELCRTIEGASWNDIKSKSLTSEYSDYLQFYRRNKELSEEKKEKIKQQIQKGRNNSREIFTIDYEQWIGYEASGAIKLNKIVREIMATYCPFSKELREQIKMQPIFEEAMARYYKEKLKKIRELESRHRLLQKDKVDLTDELVETLAYYKEQ